MAGINNNNNDMSSRYHECRRNHAIGLGGHAVDGCREFTPAGPPGTEQAMFCQACNCHRSFHRHDLADAGAFVHQPPPPPPPLMLLQRAAAAAAAPPPPEDSDGVIDFEQIRPAAANDGHQDKRMKKNPF